MLSDLNSVADVFCCAFDGVFVCVCVCWFNCILTLYYLCDEVGVILICDVAWNLSPMEIVKWRFEIWFMNQNLSFPDIPQYWRKQTPWLYQINEEVYKAEVKIGWSYYIRTTKIYAQHEKSEYIILLLGTACLFPFYIWSLHYIYTSSLIQNQCQCLFQHKHTQRIFCIHHSRINWYRITTW